MVFHRFQQLPVELRLQIWEHAHDETHLNNGLATDGQRQVCRIIEIQPPPESPFLTSKLATLEDLTIGHVCRESREVLRRCGRLNNSRDYNPTTDVVYVDNFDDWFDLNLSSLRQVRHVALSANLWYETLKIRFPTYTAAFAQLGWPSVEQGTRSNESYFFRHAMLRCPEIESITIALPPLEKDMRHYADYFPLAKRPALLRIVPYSEVQRIRITGPYTYTTWLRGSANAKRRCLGPFIKDVNEFWKKQFDLFVGYDDQRRAVTVQAGVFQYLEGPFKGEMRLSSIYKAGGEMEEEKQAADRDEIDPRV